MKKVLLLLALTSIIQAISIEVVAHNRSTMKATEASASKMCSSLLKADLAELPEAPTQVIEAKLMPASRSRPAFCQVLGYVMPNVVFNLWLPVSNWNEKFLQFGCGGACGNADFDWNWTRCERGYACIVTDTGHRGTGLDGLWSNNLQAQVDFGYRGPHVVAVAGKAITERYYGKPPRHAYFVGSSTGGRQALVEAQRFPWDFDGIISGAPWIDDTYSTMAMVWAIRALKSRDGRSIFSYADLQLLHNAALARCDMDDGVRDGIIGNPPACDFDPAELACRTGDKTNCLSATQVDAAKKAYAGPSNSKGERTFVRGLMPGSEIFWDWIVPIQPKAEAFELRSLIEAWAVEYFRSMIMPAQGPRWEIANFDFDLDYKRLGSTSESLLNAANPDLRRFRAAGGKLIMYHGWSDPLGSIPAKTVDYYETVEKTMGGRGNTQDFFRLFMVPGMGHPCDNRGACLVDYLSYLEAWVEHGKAPDRVVGAHINDTYLTAQMSKLEMPPLSVEIPRVKEIMVLKQLSLPLDSAVPVAFTRPMYPYPFYAKYKGTGDSNMAENFVALGPESAH